VAKIKAGLVKELRLGNLEARRDWGHSKEYVKVMWEMIKQDTTNDYVIATGQTHNVQEFLEKAFHMLGSITKITL
jgi:GDPmannose 4,6-dehydratase